MPTKSRRHLGLAGMAVLIGWQCWMIACLFGCDGAGLFDDRPIMSGRHPLHLYHGYLGARSLLSQGSVCCYDHAFQAGYPKTPVFDSGSRPAEMWLTLVGARWSPAAYKVGLAILLIVIPIVLYIGGRGTGLGPFEACLATGLGLIIWWGTPCRTALEAGDVDVLAAIALATCHLGLLVGFDRRPGYWPWLGLMATGSLGLYANPCVFLVLVPVLLCYYLAAGPVHGIGWHAALFASAAFMIATNCFWLIDWLASWWMHLPMAAEGELLAHRTFRSLWETSLWGTPTDRALMIGILGTGAIGILTWVFDGDRVSARVFGAAIALFLILAVGGVSWKPLGRFGTERLLIPALLLATVPGLRAGTRAVDALSSWVGGPKRGAALAAALGLAIALTNQHLCVDMAQRCLKTASLAIGLGPREQALVARLRALTDVRGRILLEERAAELERSCWTALLPMLTERSFLGGLGSDMSIEHGYARLADQILAGRLLRDWTDADLDHFCRQYNVQWIVAWSNENIERLKAWKGTRECAELGERGDGILFSLPPRSYILKGTATWLAADSQRITLANVVPEDGKIVLSLHYHASLRVSPNRVRIEREPDANDPIPFVRLRLPGPASLVTLSMN